MVEFDIYYFKKNKYSHKYHERWDECDYHCPNCGKQMVWERQGDGDYYMGVDYLCLSCQHRFYLPVGTVDTLNDDSDRQRLKHLTEIE